MNLIIPHGLYKGEGDRDRNREIWRYGDREMIGR
jgi:hypothetical protein